MLIKQSNGKNIETNASIPEKPKYKFLFVSWESLSGDLAWDIKKSGHEGKIYINSSQDKDV